MLKKSKRGLLSLLEGKRRQHRALQQHQPGAGAKAMLQHNGELSTLVPEAGCSLRVLWNQGVAAGFITESRMLVATAL